MKKISAIFGCLLILTSIYFGSCSNSSDSYYIRQLKDSIAELNREKNSYNNDTPGESDVNSATNNEQGETASNESNGNIYEFTDAEGTKWKLNLNTDETVTLEDNGKIYYGSWQLYSPIGDLPLVSFTYNEMPRIALPNEKKRCQFLAIVGNYIYEDWQNVQSKNPRYRLPLKKIK